MNDLVIVIWVLLAGYPVITWHLYKMHKELQDFKSGTCDLLYDIAHKRTKVEVIDHGDFERVRISRVDK